MTCIGKAGWAVHIASVGEVYVGKQCPCLVVAANPAVMRAVTPNTEGIINARSLALILMKFAVKVHV
jgi:hypothetical protein